MRTATRIYLSIMLTNNFRYDTSSMFFSLNAKTKHNPIIITSPYFRFTLKKDSRSIETGHGALLMNSIVVFPTPGAAGPSPMVWTTTTIATISSKIIHKWSYIQTCLKLYRQPEVENFFSLFLFFFFFRGGGGGGRGLGRGYNRSLISNVWSQMLKNKFF